MGLEQGRLGQSGVVAVPKQILFGRSRIKYSSSEYLWWGIISTLTHITALHQMKHTGSNEENRASKLESYAGETLPDGKILVNFWPSQSTIQITAVIIYGCLGIPIPWHWRSSVPLSSTANWLRESKCNIPEHFQHSYWTVFVEWNKRKQKLLKFAIHY